MGHVKFPKATELLQKLTQLANAIQVINNAELSAFAEEFVVLTESAQTVQLDREKSEISNEINMCFEELISSIINHENVNWDLSASHTAAHLNPKQKWQEISLNLSNENPDFKIAVFLRQFDLTLENCAALAPALTAYLSTKERFFPDCVAEQDDTTRVVRFFVTKLKIAVSQKLNEYKLAKNPYQLFPYKEQAATKKLKTPFVELQSLSCTS